MLRLCNYCLIFYLKSRRFRQFWSRQLDGLTESHGTSISVHASVTNCRSTEKRVLPRTTVSNLKWKKLELTSDCSTHTKGTSANATTRRMVNSWSTWTSVFWHTYTRARAKNIYIYIKKRMVQKKAVFCQKSQKRANLTATCKNMVNFHCQIWWQSLITNSVHRVLTKSSLSKLLYTTIQRFLQLKWTLSTVHFICQQSP